MKDITITIRGKASTGKTQAALLIQEMLENLGVEVTQNDRDLRGWGLNVDNFDAELDRFDNRSKYLEDVHVTIETEQLAGAPC